MRAQLTKTHRRNILLSIVAFQLQIFFVILVAHSEQGEVRIDADNITRNAENKQVEAKGSVIITQDDKTITGDFAKYSMETGLGEVVGDVTYHDENANIASDRVKFDYNTGQGTMYNASGYFGENYYFSGDIVERKNEDNYIVTEGAVTTCNEVDPHWRMEAEETDVTLEGYAFMKNMVFRAGDVPIFYLPYFIAPAKSKRSTGLLIPGIGYSSKNGATIEQALFLAIADNMDATMTYEYLGERGNRYAGEYRYILGAGTYGNLNINYLQETQAENNRDLWKLKYNHRQKLPWKVNGVVHVDMESEENYSREYDKGVNDRTRRYTDSYATLTRTWATRNLYAIVREQKTTLPGSEDTVRKIPSITFTNQQEQLFDSLAYGSITSSFTAYELTSDASGSSTQFDVNRLDLYPVFSLPYTVAPWLSLTPSFGMRYTMYSNGIDENGDELGESFTREYYTAGLALTGPRFSRIFEMDSTARPKAKHLITPSVNWSYVPGYEVDGDDRKKVRIIDGVDAGAPKNVISYQILNQFLVKEVLGPQTARTLEVVRFRIAQSYNIREATRTENPETEKRPFSSILFDLDTKPFPWLMINYETSYDIYEDIQDYEKYEIGYRYEDIFHFALDRRRKFQGRSVKDSIWDTAYFEVNPAGRMSMDYSIIYDEAKSEVFSHVLRTRYRDDCFSLGVDWFERKIGAVDSAGVSTTENETGFLLRVTLEGIGDVFGKGRPKLAGRKL